MTYLESSFLIEIVSSDYQGPEFRAPVSKSYQGYPISQLNDCSSTQLAFAGIFIPALTILTLSPRSSFSQIQDLYLRCLFLW